MIRFYEELASTQDEMKNLESSGEVSHLDVVYARLQTSGRGRQGRNWTSMPGNLSASIYIKDFQMPLTWIPLWIGVSLLRAVVSGFPELVGNPEPPQSHGKRIRLKWPNDLMLESGEKLGGILCEKTDSGVVAGVGLNLEVSPELPEGYSTSIRDCLKAVSAPNREAHPREFLDLLVSGLRNEPTIESLRDDFMRFSIHHPGQSVSWRNTRSGERLHGCLIGLGAHGDLRVEMPNGRVESLFGEEIEGIRA
jgi:BirA family biotin operon repressor/biotin-[acetyl-CoA-carboxylase] ligase